MTISALSHTATALVGELVEAILVADVLPELAHVGHRADFDARHDRAELVEQVLAVLPRVPDDDGSGETRLGHGVRIRTA